MVTSPIRFPRLPLAFLSCLILGRLVAGTPVLPGPTGLPPALPAFPGAEGFGAGATGGRGGAILEVTNLNDDGPGSFRAAVTAAGPRIVIFRTGGTIRLSRSIVVTQPFLTIAGQTAPGDGIAVKGNELEIRTHDVIVRGLRWRSGEGPNGPNTPRRAYGCIRVSPGQNVIVDHCSLSWSTDKCATTWHRATRNVTYQWCILSEPLAHAHPEDAEHARAFLLGDYTQNITLHHNLFAHAQYRMPEVKGASSSEIINNVCYNWSIAATLYSDWESHGPIRSNHINNYAIAGPDTPKGSEAHSVQLWTPKWGTTMPAGTRIHVAGDIGPFRPEGKGNDTDVVYYRGLDRAEKYLSPTPVVTPSGVETGFAVSVTPAPLAKEAVLRHAGAIFPTRDAVDLRIIQDVRHGTGRIINHMSDLGPSPWPRLEPGTPPVDSDHDGMPDSWESAHGLNPSNPADRNTVAPSGYTWVEEYINQLIPQP